MKRGQDTCNVVIHYASWNIEQLISILFVICIGVRILHKNEVVAPGDIQPRQ